MCVVLGEDGPSCSNLRLLGRVPSSFGLDLGGLAPSVFRGAWKVEDHRTPVLCFLCLEEI